MHQYCHHCCSQDISMLLLLMNTPKSLPLSLSTLANKSIASALGANEVDLGLKSREGMSNILFWFSVPIYFILLVGQSFLKEIDHLSIISDILYIQLVLFLAQQSLVKFIQSLRYSRNKWKESEWHFIQDFSDFLEVGQFLWQSVHKFHYAGDSLAMHGPSNFTQLTY